MNLVNHRGRRNNRIVTKSYRNGVTTVNLQDATSVAATPPTNAATANAYEFSEDNEKCEKIATFRKRRLADKKYEFSEDNSENIVPFTKTRSTSRTFAMTLFGASSSTGGGGIGIGATARNLYRPPAVAASSSHHLHLSSSCVSPSSPAATTYASINHSHGDVHRSSSHGPPSMAGFRSPPTGKHLAASTASHIYATQRSSPPTLSLATQQMLSFKPLTTLSPLQVSMTKRNHFEMGGGNMSPNTTNGPSPFLSPRRDDHNKVVEVPILGGEALEKPTCTKKFQRRYVEEDDAMSVITSEEDDCISPGYHTSLPVEVHGSCYSEMQMISQASSHQLRHCASVVITQHSFDLETFTYYVTSKLCQKNNKIYDVFYDWAYELISICPHSSDIICMLIVQFIVRDPSPCLSTTTTTNTTTATSNNTTTTTATAASTATNGGGDCVNCINNCSTKMSAAASPHCVQHRRPCECRVLFTWNIETGAWQVLDYGELLETKSFDVRAAAKRGGGHSGLGLAATAKKIANELTNSLCPRPDYTQNLRVLYSNVNKSRTCLSDLDNMVEFYLKRPRCSD